MSRTTRAAARAFGSGAGLTFDQLLAAPIRWPRVGRLAAETGRLKGLGPATAQALADELGIATVEDLLLHLPRAFETAPDLVAMSQLRQGQKATVQGVVGTVGRFEPTGPPRRGPRRGRLVATLRDSAGAGSIKAVWFNQPWLADRLRPGMGLRLVGTADRRGFIVANHEEVPVAGGDPDGPEPCLAERAWRDRDQVPAEIHTRAPVPVHPATERISARQLRRFVWQALADCEARPTALPARLRVEHRLPDAAAALRAAHFPALVDADPEPALRALAFEELLLHQLVLARRRARRRRLRGEPIPAAGSLFGDWLDGLPFELTGDQRRAIAEIGGDLESGRPMQRLLVGEVGSGKTVVALAAMIRVVEAGRQAAIMAPTEVLAEQHAATINRLLAGTGLECGLLTGSTPVTQRRRLLSALASGELALVAGTHALLEEPVAFADLALGVVDEQHRFGVRQRQRLDGKGPGGRRPHLLQMTATPIPRSLALLGYGDLDASELRELPAGRKPIETRLIEPRDRARAFEDLRAELRAGRQAYVICPLVEESEALQAKAALAEAERLAADELTGFELGVLHGRLPAAEKRQVMAAFADGEIDVLVATTVVEVGVDVPNATTIVIEGAERFGLAQLHQLRGRVGRGRHRSLCLLMPAELGGNARRRLAALTAHSDGFHLAELDLRLRGAGELLGLRQHGLPEFKAVVMPEHAPLLEAARSAAGELLAGTVPPAGIDLMIEIAEARFGGVSAEVIAA